MFNLVIMQVSFYVYESKNPILGLIKVQEIIQSLQYKSEAGLTERFICNNFVDICRSEIEHLEKYRTISKGLKAGEIAQILKYREGINTMADTIKELAFKKMEFYTILLSHPVEFDRLTSCGVLLKEKMSLFHDKVTELSKINLRNLKLLAELTVYELCVLEKPFVSHDLHKLYIELRNEEATEQQRIDMGAEEVNLYSSSNAVLLVTCHKSKFRVSQFTSNTPSMFEVSPDSLLGSEIKKFMPKHIGEVHDQIIVDFLSGIKSRINAKTGIKTVLQSTNERKDISVCKSIRVIPQLEFRLSGDLFIASLISLRKTKEAKLIYTDGDGKIFGTCNSFDVGKINGINILERYPALNIWQSKNFSSNRFDSNHYEDSKVISSLCMPIAENKLKESPQRQYSSDSLQQLTYRKKDRQCNQTHIQEKIRTAELKIDNFKYRYEKEIEEVEIVKEQKLSPLHSTIIEVLSTVPQVDPHDILQLTPDETLTLATYLFTSLVLHDKATAKTMSRVHHSRSKSLLAALPSSTRAPPVTPLARRVGESRQRRRSQQREPFAHFELAALRAKQRVKEGVDIVRAPTGSQDGLGESGRVVRSDTTPRSQHEVSLVATLQVPAGMGVSSTTRKSNIGTRNEVRVGSEEESVSLKRLVSQTRLQAAHPHRQHQHQQEVVGRGGRSSSQFLVGLGTSTSMLVPVRDMLHARQSVLARSAKCGGRVGAGGGLARGRVGSGGGGVRRSRSADLMSMHFCLDTRLHLESQLMQTLTLMENSEHATSAKRVAERVWAVVEGGGPTAKSVCEDIEDVGVQLEMNRRKRAMGERRGGKRQGKARRLTERLRRGGRGRGRRGEGGGEGEEESVDGAGKMGGVEQSTVLHSSVNSVSEGSRAVRVRARIKREEALKGVFRRWEWMLVLVCAAAVVMRSYFENQYHDSISNAYNSYQRIISLSRIMRPLGEIYKNSIKQNLLANARITVDQRSKVNNHTSIIIPYS
jgi:hypothetical protein